MARGGIGSADFNFDSQIHDDQLDTVTMSFDVPVADITSFTDVYQNVVAGKPSAKIDIAGSWDGASNAADDIIFGELGSAAKAYDFEPIGGTGYNGFAIVTSYSITASVNDAVKFSASLQHNGGAAAIDGAAPTRT